MIMAIVHGNDSSEWIDWPRTTDNADTVYGYGGVDRIYGHGGNDLIFGGAEDDWIYGMGDNDTLKGGGGADHLYGGSGIDTASYDDSPVGVSVFLAPGGTGAGYNGDAEGDRFDSIENVSGSAYLDALHGNEGANTLNGLAGNDYLRGRDGADTLYGGSGNRDTAVYDTSSEGVYVSLISGRGFGGEAEGDTLIGIEDIDGSPQDDLLVGNDYGNRLYGRGSDDSLKGGGGIDTLYGHAGNDILDGGDFVDWMYGGLDNDIYIVDNGSDLITEYGGEGSDTVRASVSYVLTAGADVELLTTTDDSGTAALNLTGNATANTVRGNNGNNVINGGHGNDELTGRAGTDWFLFDTPLDAMFNVDRITDLSVTDDTIRLDQTIFSSSLTVGSSVAGSQFVIGTAALDAGDRIIYNNATGVVLYDSDGTGATAAIQFAQLSAGLADPTDIDPLTNFDFFVVA
jgi:Ca2+-binding RTX toxin-like protein